MASTKSLQGVIAAAILGAGGCAVGPASHPPPPPVPAAWISPPANGLTEIAVASSDWWSSFNDAELDSLIQRAVRSNPDMRVSEARLRQARAIRQMSAADLWPT